MEDARDAVRKGKATVAVVLPKDFGAAASRTFFNGSNKPDIQLLYDPSHAPERSMVEGMLSGDVMQVVSKEMFTGQTGREQVNESLARVDRNQSLAPEYRKTLHDLLQNVQQLNQQQSSSSNPTAGGLTIPFNVQDEAVTARTGVAYNGFAHSFAGMSIQFVLFMGIDMGIGVLLLRQRGLWKRLRAAPLSRGLLLGARAASTTLIALLILTVVFVFARLVFGVRIEGSFPGFVGVCAAFSLMTATFGLMIAALGKTPEASRGLSVFATIVLVMLGGAWVPAFLFPQWLRTATLAIPTRWAMDGLDGMTWRGLGFSAALGPIGILLLFAAIFGAVAVLRFRWEAEG